MINSIGDLSSTRRQGVVLVVLFVSVDDAPAVPPGVVVAVALAAPFLEVAEAPVGDDMALDPPAGAPGAAPVLMVVWVRVFVVTVGGTTTVVGEVGVVAGGVVLLTTVVCDGGSDELSSSPLPPHPKTHTATPRLTPAIRAFVQDCLNIL